METGEGIMQEIELFNGETSESVRLQVTPEVAIRLNNDPFYATRVFNESLHGMSNPNIGVPVEPRNEVMQEEMENERVGVTEGTFRWPHEAILLLIAEYETNVPKFSSPNYTKKVIWNNISKKMANNNYIVTGMQCESKWSGLKKIYKRYKDHNQTSGNNRKHWPYFDVMDQLLGQRPDICPISTASSSGMITACAEKTSTPGPSQEQPTVDDAQRHNKWPMKKAKKKNDLISLMNEMRDERKQRHEEKMASKNRAISILEQMLNANDN